MNEVKTWVNIIEKEHYGRTVKSLSLLSLILFILDSNI